jgi:hypothetical protein
MTFCTSFALYKVKKTFGGSKWKLTDPTYVSRYLAYVSAKETEYLGYVLITDGIKPQKR